MYYTVPDVANMLGVNNETARRWIREGKIYAKRNMGRGGNEVLLKDVVAFANKPPKSFLANLVMWLDEHNIPYKTISTQCEESGTQAEATDDHPIANGFLDTVCATATAAAAMANPFTAIATAPMLIAAKATAKGRRKKSDQNYEIQLLPDPKKDALSTVVEAESSAYDIKDALSISSSTEDMNTASSTPASPDIDELIRKEQMNLIRLRQELAQVQAKIAVAEGQIEYYKLLKSEN